MSATRADSAGDSISPNAERRAFAISLARSLAEDARSYQDSTLRPRILARAADVLWDADNIAARLLFARAWEAAQRADSDDGTVNPKDNAPEPVAALRRRVRRDLRSEVLAIVARRDRSLGEEFLKKLTEESKQEAAEAKNEQAAQTNADSRSLSDAMSKRLQVADRLLNDGQVEQALAFAAPALERVNASSIGFLSALRLKQPEAADQRFSLLLARAEFDPSSDANTVSGLSSYAFTPGFYITFGPDGAATWTQGSSVTINPPNLPPIIVARFFRVAGAILLRPVLPANQDQSSCGRIGRYLVVRRLLPLFDKYAPDTGVALRSQLAALADERLKSLTSDDSSLLTNGLQPDTKPANAWDTLQDRLDHARNSWERDEICADVAVALADAGDARALDVAERIDNSDRRADVSRYVQFQIAQLAIKHRDAQEAARLAKADQLTHAQRAWIYLQLARLLNSQRDQAQDFLEHAAAESRNVVSDKPDRTVLLTGVATQFMSVDKIRAWELMDEVIKAANSTEEFTGENKFLTFPMGTKSGVKFTTIGGNDFALSGAFRLLTKDDLYRSVSLVKSFNKDAPRAIATLAIVQAVLEK